MPFDAEGFMRAEFRRRTHTITLPDLSDWFTGGDPSVWVVQNLTASELAVANEAEQKHKSVGHAIKALSEAGMNSQLEAFRAMLGTSPDKTPGEIAKRIEMLVAGSVTPKIDYPMAVRLSEVKAIEFYELTNAIWMLTGKGADVGKPAAASQTTTA